MGALGDSAPSDSGGEKPGESPGSANPKRSWPRMGSHLPFMQPSEIYGAEATFSIRRDPSTQQSGQRRTDMNVMAESNADATGKEEEERKLSVRKMNSFTLDAMRGSVSIEFHPLQEWAEINWSIRCGA